MGEHAIQRACAGRRQASARSVVVTRCGERVLPDPVSERRGGPAGVPVQPVARQPSGAGRFATRRSEPRGHQPGVAARAAGRRSGSPAPAEAKCGRPPPLPPLSAAIRLTRSPALLPGADQVVGERDVDRAPPAGAEEHQHRVPLSLPERIGDLVPARRDPRWRSRAIVSSTPPTSETSPRTARHHRSGAASASGPRAAARSSRSCSTRRTRCSG